MNHHEVYIADDDREKRVLISITGTWCYMLLDMNGLYPKTVDNLVDNLVIIGVDIA